MEEPRPQPRTAGLASPCHVLVRQHLRECTRVRALRIGHERTRALGDRADMLAYSPDGALRHSGRPTRGTPPSCRAMRLRDLGEASPRLGGQNSHLAAGDPCQHSLAIGDLGRLRLYPPRSSSPRAPRLGREVQRWGPEAPGTNRALPGLRRVASCIKEKIYLFLVPRSDGAGLSGVENMRYADSGLSLNCAPSAGGTKSDRSSSQSYLHHRNHLADRS